MKSLYEWFVCVLYPRYINVTAAQEAMRVAVWSGIHGSMAESCLRCGGFHIHFGHRDV